MAAGTQSRATPDAESDPDDRPEITVCESTPGKAVFLESGNTDGWIASDATVPVTQ